MKRGSQWHLNAWQQGFTLVELVMVIVIVSILGVGLVSFITNSVQGVSNTADRQQRASIAWIVSEKLSREIRNGLPNSFRLNAGSTCIEFIPTVAGTDYLSVPTAAGASAIDVINFPNYLSADVGAGDRVAVYPSTLTSLYSVAANSVISGSTIDTISALNGGPEGGTQTITLNAAHQFLSDSPSQRLFVVRDPVMFCFASDGFLYRYSDYGFNSTMPDPSAAGAPAGTPVTIANRLSNASFAYVAGTLTRTGVVTFEYQVAPRNAGTTDPNQVLSQEVQIRNVP